MNVTKRQKRRIRNLVCIQYSIVKMLLVIAGFELLGRGLSLMQGTQSATQEIEGEVIWSEDENRGESPDRVRGCRTWRKRQRLRL